MLELEPGKKITGVKAISMNEAQFQGHFPQQPIFPGVMQIEALAQLAGICMLKSNDEGGNNLFFFGGVDGVKWKRPVVPGDMLVMEAEVLKFNKKFGIAKATGRAYVDGQLAVEVKEMTFALQK